MNCRAGLPPCLPPLALATQLPVPALPDAYPSAPPMPLRGDADGVLSGDTAPEPAFETVAKVETTPVRPSSIESRIFFLKHLLPGFNRVKQVWIYLPPGYDRAGDKRYPVVYMQDGQNLFESRLSYADNPYIDEAMARELQQGLNWYGSWRVDTRLDRLFREEKTDGVIVVGISSEDGNRTAEYSPWPWPDAPQPEAEHYVEFIVQVLKPYVDDHFLTLAGRRHTAIVGSSLGGVVALYAGLKYQQVFSKVAALSPVLTDEVFGQHLREHIQRHGRTHSMDIYLDLGDREPSFGPIEPVYRSLREAGFQDDELWFRHIPDGSHRMEHWGERFPEALLWLYRSGRSGRAG